MLAFLPKSSVTNRESSKENKIYIPRVILPLNELAKLIPYGSRSHSENLAIPVARPQRP